MANGLAPSSSAASVLLTRKRHGQDIELDQRIARTAPDLKLMDNRSGAITEARAMGADPCILMHDAAQHASITITDRYVRGRSESADKVVQLRRGK